MIGYRPNDSHTLRRKGASNAFAAVRTFLERCTDCTTGVARPKGAEAELTWTLDECTTEIGTRFASATPPAYIALDFEGLLKDVTRGTLLPYRSGDLPEARSRLRLSIWPDNIMCSPHLWWPYDDITPEILRHHDAIAELTGIILTPARFVRGFRGKTGKLRTKLFRFERARFALTPADDRSVALKAAIVAAPDDDGPRLAYADWLLQQGDPLGEMIVVQCQLAALANDDPRRAALQRRESGLLRKHARTWLRLPYLDEPIMRRGFIEAAHVRLASRFIANAVELRALAPMLRELIVTGTHATDEAAKLGATGLAIVIRR